MMVLGEAFKARQREQQEFIEARVRAGDLLNTLRDLLNELPVSVSPRVAHRGRKIIADIEAAAEAKVEGREKSWASRR